MRRRIFVVLWVMWLAAWVLPIAGVALYVRITDGWRIENVLLSAAAIWIPFFMLIALQYIVTGIANPLRLIFDAPRD